MRWLVLSDDWPPQLGGVATWSFGAAQALEEAGDEVRVLTGVRGKKWAGLKGLVELRRTDAVLATTWAMARIVAEPCRQLGIPLHIVFHGSGATRPNPIESVCRGARVWAVSEFLVRVLAERSIQATWIPSPIEPEDPVGDPRGPWVMVARATPLKGGDRFVRIVREAGVHGIVVGDGPALVGWKQLATEIGADVQFLGALDRESTRSVLEGAACSMLLSRADRDGSGAEGLGLVLLEARARGVLAVGSDVGGIPEAADLVLTDADNPARSVTEVREALGAGTWREGHGRGPLAAALRT